MFKIYISIVSLIVFSINISYASFHIYEAQLDAANSLSEQMIINNHMNDPENYNLNDNVLRQEIAAVSRGVAKLEKKSKCNNIFNDLSSNNPNNWACVNVEVLVDNDLISKNTNFRPEDNITKSEAIGMLIKSIGFDYEYNEWINKNWQQQVVEYAANIGVAELFTDYNTNATRGWIFLVADNIIKLDEKNNWTSETTDEIIEEEEQEEEIIVEERVIILDAQRWDYNPNVIRVKKWEKVTLKINNTDVTHWIIISGMGVSSNDEVIIDTSKTWTFEFRCKNYCWSGHKGMVWTIIVE